MKKMIFCLPAISYTIAVVALNIVLKTFSPLWYVWVALLWAGGILLSKEKAWGSLFGLLPAIHLLYMGTQHTGQVINIETPLGLITALHFLGCSFWLWKKKPSKQHKEPTE